MKLVLPLLLALAACHLDTSPTVPPTPSQQDASAGDEEDTGVPVTEPVEAK